MLQQYTKRIEEEREREKNGKIDGKTIGYVTQKVENNNSDDISDLVDDIFG